MFFFHFEYVTVLLYAFGQISVYASVEGDVGKIGASSTDIFSYFPARWKEVIKLTVESSESTCADEVLAVIEAVESGQTWAMQMLDASSKLPSGLLRGNKRDYGMYDECIEVNEHYNNVSIRGKHCMVSFMSISQIFTPVVSDIDDRIFSSVCFPSSCNETQVEQIINVTIQSIPIISGLGFGATVASCSEVELVEDFTVGEVLTIMFFLAVGVFVIFCTIYDFLGNRKSSKASTRMNTFVKFSLRTNAIELLNPKELPSIQGIRVLSMYWLTIPHHFVPFIYEPMPNLADILKLTNSWLAVVAQVAPFSVDTFLLLSGFCMAYSVFKKLKSGKQINWLKFYVHRYLRLTASIAVLILFSSFLVHRVAGGSMWKALLSSAVDSCRENWWVNLFYLHNFEKEEEMCLHHTWYLAVDMQLFWISPIIMYLLYYWPKHGRRILGFFLLASIVTPPVDLAINGYSSATFRVNFDPGEIIWDDMFDFYMATYNRGFPFFLGILLGYDVTNNKRQLTKVNSTIYWIIACALMLNCAWPLHYIYNTNFAYNPVLEIVFALTSRPFWSIAMAWIVYACTQGYGGPVARFLSLPFFRPLSRLSYSIYLLHLPIEMIKASASRNSGLFDFSAVFDRYLGSLVLTMIAGLIFSLFIELPAAALENIIFDYVPKSDKVITVKKTRETKRHVFQSTDNNIRRRRKHSSS
ncbi:nose resistant to fluoxetine protein 6-like [Diprion similis]|uniref:nose resistant to fluoxetine protein 6-like n=1 Tax=Diprion similis TaxID=362088 RepID=UPI001EF8108A|nr:nose resistant to fluoxetine protein 6-like [Diprion similis]